MVYIKRSTKYMVPVMTILSLLLASSSMVKSDPALQLNQSSFDQPDLFVAGIQFEQNKQLEDGKTINITVLVTNNEIENYTGLDLQVSMQKILVVEHAARPPATLYNASIPVIPEQETIVQSFTLSLEFGQYDLSASLMNNHTILKSTTFSMKINVLSQPIGNVFSIFSYLLLLIVIIVSITTLPIILDYVKRRNL